jgi:hypothetical protein
MSQNLSFECKHSILTFTQKLGLFYDTAKTAKSGVSVSLGFTLLVALSQRRLGPRARLFFCMFRYHTSHAFPWFVDLQPHYIHE